MEIPPPFSFIVFLVKEIHVELSVKKNVFCCVNGFASMYGPRCILSGMHSFLPLSELEYYPYFFILQTVMVE
jgi:hypothetical protein